MEKAIVIQVDHPKPFDYPGVPWSGLTFFTIHFKYSDPKIAQQVDGQLVGLLVSKNLEAQEAAPGGPPVRIHVLDSPTFPVKPTGPGSVLLTASGAIAGALLGLLIATMLRLSRTRSAKAG